MSAHDDGLDILRELFVDLAPTTRRPTPKRRPFERTEIRWDGSTGSIVVARRVGYSTWRIDAQWRTPEGGYDGAGWALSERTEARARMGADVLMELRTSLRGEVFTEVTS